MTLAPVFLLFALLALRAEAQTFCQRGAGPILDNAGQCLLSANYDVANCCFTCPVQNATGFFSYCMDLYDLGFATCAQPGALAARQAACAAIGGSISSGAFMCVCSGGTNTSQTNYTAPTRALTAAPTSGSAGSPIAVLSLIALPALLIALAH